MIKIYCHTDEYENKCWCKEDTFILHREDGPAVEYANGDKSWYQNGLKHRLDGPVVETKNSYKTWYYHGKWIDVDNQEDFERYIKLMVFE